MTCKERLLIESPPLRMGLQGKQRASTSSGIALGSSLSNHPIKKDILKSSTSCQRMIYSQILRMLGRL